MNGQLNAKLPSVADCVDALRTLGFGIANGDALANAVWTLFQADHGPRAEAIRIMAAEGDAELVSMAVYYLLQRGLITGSIEMGR